MERVFFFHASIRVQLVARVCFSSAAFRWFFITGVVFDVIDTICIRQVSVRILFAIIQNVGRRAITVLGVGYNFLRWEDTCSVFVHSQAGEVRAWYERCVPNKDLSIIFITTVAIEPQDMRSIRSLTWPMLDFPKLAYVIV